MEYKHGIVCPACSKGKLTVTFDPLKFSYRGHDQIFEGFDSFKCDLCPESFLNKRHSSELEIMLRACREVLDKKSEDDAKVTWTFTRMEADENVKSN